MKVELNKKGELKILTENETEAYAMENWMRNFTSNNDEGEPKASKLIYEDADDNAFGFKPTKKDSD